MTDRKPGPTLHRSVFARLLAIMLAMAAFLLAMVAGFYLVIVIPGIRASLDREVGPHTRAIADTRPDLETARTIAAKGGIDIRFVGTDGAWTTNENVPTLEDLEQPRHRGWLNHFLIPQRTFYVAAVPDGHYIFVHSVGEGFNQAHTQMVILLLILMIGVFVTAYLVLRHALRPLRLLGAGVTKLSEGNLDVAVPRQSHDEFGVLTDAFNHMARRVRDMVQARDHLLRGVSHELRSPLTRMKVALEMLPDGAQKRSMAADVAEMETMVTELLELERMRDGGSIRVERLELIALVREMTERYRDRAPSVRVSTAPTELHLDADADGVRTVLRNLIENALKFSQPDSRAIEITVAAHGDEAIVRVTDDGSGIPQGNEDRLFEPFFRPDPSRSKKTGGYGLGLSICKRIMEAHGGTIGVEPHEGHGVTFVLAFPMVH